MLDAVGRWPGFPPLRGQAPSCVRPPAGPTLNHMGKLALLAFAVLLPTLIGGAILAAVRGYRRLSKLRQSWLRQTRPLPPEPVDRVAARLRRLRAELEEIENQPGGTAKRHHIVALRGAYLDTLSSACQRFGVSPPAGAYLDTLSSACQRFGSARLRRPGPAVGDLPGEAALREHGLDVREAAVR